jgi:biopolymer transport protein ExbB
MKTILLALSLAGGVAVANDLEHAASAVHRDLEQGLRELATLRDTIAAEKLPLARELTGLEEQLGALRKEYDRVTRAQDLANLELANLRSEIKARQDEVAYIGNLMDEFARGLENKIHVSELQRYAPLIETAKAAPGNVDLSASDRFGRQAALVKTSVVRVRELIGGARFAGKAVDPQGTVTDGQFALIGPAVLFSSADGQTAGVAVSQSGSTKPVVRPLEKKVNVAMAGIIATGEGLLPLDPTRGGAIRELIHRASLVYYFKKGGPIMWPLLITSILALTVIIERLWFLAKEKKRRQPAVLAGMMAAVENGDVEEAIRVGTSSSDFIVKALTYALTHRQKSLTDALQRAAGQELHRFTRAIPLLDTIVTLAPLLGLLGTVTGMMSSFGMLGGAELGAPTEITGGIAEALIATCVGLGIAIMCLLPMNYLHTQAANARQEMEDACAHLELLMKPIIEAEKQLNRSLTVKLNSIAQAEAQTAAKVEVH